jgi:hypothetical protein
MDPRTLCIFGMLAFAATGIVNAFIFGLELRRFVQSTPILTSTRDLERFKEVVAHQMIAALAQIGLLALPPVIYFIGLWNKVLEPSDIVYVVAPSLLILVVAGAYRGWEKRAKTIQTTDPELEAQRNAVVRTWMRKPWPDW